MRLHATVVVVALLSLCSCKKADVAEFEINRLHAIGLMVESYRLSHHSYPRTLETARDFYPDVKLIDSWGTAVEYSSEETTFRVTSAGPDQAFGTSDDLSIDSTAIREFLSKRRSAPIQPE